MAQYFPQLSKYFSMAIFRPLAVAALVSRSREAPLDGSIFARAISTPVRPDYFFLAPIGGGCSRVVWVAAWCGVWQIWRGISLRTTSVVVNGLPILLRNYFWDSGPRRRTIIFGRDFRPAPVARRRPPARRSTAHILLGRSPPWPWRP
jgi:hypothetical protein